MNNIYEMDPIYKWSIDGRKITYLDWNQLVEVLETIVPKTEAPNGCYPVTNLYVELVNGEPKLRVEYEVND